ncbi:MAG: hypothetical protein M3167_00310 [Acidobacteriota bacterium]|nr:hypothetical protein [Acidobacteriota bacterium]
MIDVHNLKCFDPTTKAEKLQRFHESLEYLTYLSGVGRAAADQRFLAEEEAQLTDPLAYYDATIGPNTDIFRMIITHPDMDHMTGLHRIHAQEPRKHILNFWHTGPHDFNLASTTDEDWDQCPYDPRDWETYKQLRAGNGLTSIQQHQGNTGHFWSDDGVELWAPTPALETLAEQRQEPNILSMILKITYKGRSLLLGGDATADETWPAIYPKIDMKGISVLKASHHGRKTGYHQPSVAEMSPWLTITSVGRVEHDATDRYRQYSEYTVSLRRAGNIKITIDDNGKLFYPAGIAAHWKPRITSLQTHELAAPKRTA